MFIQKNKEMINNNFSNKSKIILITIGLMIFLIVPCLAEAQISLDFHGEWYSEGFQNFNLWSVFVQAFANVISTFTIIDNEGEIALAIVGADGQPMVSDHLISFDKNKGTLNIKMNATLPNGLKEINYDILVNKNKNISKYVDYKQYLNKTMGELLGDLVKKNLEVTFVGSRSNITMVPNSSLGGFDIYYEKNINGNFTSPIVEETSVQEGENYSPNISFNSNNNVNNGSNDGNSSVISNNSLNNTKNNVNNSNLDFKITNALPNASKITMNVNEKKSFSIGNKEYDEVNWYVDSKILGQEASFDYIPLKKGDYVVKVELKKDKLVRTKTWQVSVLEEKGSSLWILIIIILVIVVGFGLLGWFMYSKINKENQTQNMRSVNDSSSSV